MKTYQDYLTEAVTKSTDKQFEYYGDGRNTDKIQTAAGLIVQLSSTMNVAADNEDMRSFSIAFTKMKNTMKELNKLTSV